MTPRRPPPPRLWRSAALLRLLLAVTAAVVAYYVFPFESDGTSVAENPWRTVVAVFAFVILVGLLGRQARALVLGGRRATIEGLIFLVVLVVLFFASMYVIMAGQFAELSTKTDALYFSIATLATVGYGDVHAVGQGARIVVTVQMIFDLGYLAVVASVVSGFIRARAAAVRGNAGPGPKSSR